MQSSSLSISQAEVCVQAGLTALRSAPLSEQILLALSYLAPKGYTPVIQFEEEGRKKRSSASTDCWNPDTGEIVIYFEREGPDQGHSHVHAVQSAPLVPAQAPSVEEATNFEKQMIECCRLLADAEKAGRNFIALKWFRDDFLCTRSEPWTQVAQTRQDVLTAAIESGKILTSKLNNPKAPQFPTTTIRLNPDADIPGLTPRFRPVTMRGEPGSATLLRDRGIN